MHGVNVGGGGKLHIFYQFQA